MDNEIGPNEDVSRSLSIVRHVVLVCGIAIAFAFGLFVTIGAAIEAADSPIPPDPATIPHQISQPKGLENVGGKPLGDDVPHRL